MFYVLLLFTGATIGKRAIKHTDNTVKRNKSRSLKISVVGDGWVGKACMLKTYTSNIFPQEYIATVLDVFSKDIFVDGNEYNLDLWVFAGQEDYERLRLMSYPNTNCFLLCYSISNRSSFENIAVKWHPEIQQYCSKVPVILIGTKKDLRVTNDQTFVSPEDAEKLKIRIGAIKSFECSALTYEGLDEIFVEAVRASTQQKKSSFLTSCFK